MALRQKSGAALQRGRRIFVVVALAALALQLLPSTEFLDGEAFAVQNAGLVTSVQGVRSFGQGRQMLAPEDLARGRCTRKAAEVGLTITQKVVNAMGAGAVASVIQAALSAVGEPIVNRALVKRMTLMQAIKDVKPIQMLEFFKTTLATNFLKFPFFEAINAFCGALPIDPSIRGVVTGFVFTTATLPVTNYRYRKSMQLEVNWGNLYEAYLPTVIRDIAYGIVRNWSTLWLLGINSAWKATSPEVLFIVVILGCLGSAPFNEWRGFLLQAKGQELTFKEFFKPQNFVRSTALGAMKQGLALAVGYWCAPPVSKFVSELIRSIRG